MPACRGKFVSAKRACCPQRAAPKPIPNYKNLGKAAPNFPARGCPHLTQLTQLTYLTLRCWLRLFLRPLPQTIRIDCLRKPPWEARHTGNALTLEGRRKL